MNETSSANETPSELNLTVANKSFRIKVPQSKIPMLREASKMVEEKMKNIATDGKIIGSDKIAIMASVNLAFELLSANKAQQTYFAHLSEKIKCLSEKIDNQFSQTLPRQEGNKTPLETSE
jgi:cell division protein ZapA